MKTRTKLYLLQNIAFYLSLLIVTTKIYAQGSPESKFNSSLQDFNVSTYTGAAMVNIPIYTFSEGGINIPISLSCNTSGIRVDEKASLVGLGWTLNAGGMISRMVMGAPDEGSYNGNTYIKGYYKDGGYYSTNVADDHEPDQFFMNVGGTSIRFMFNESGKIYTVPASDIKIEYHINQSKYSNLTSFYQFTDFVVTMPDGVKYTFGTKQEANSYAYQEAIEKTFFGDPASCGGIDKSNCLKQFVSRAWMLTKITTTNGFSVNLDYSHDRFKVKNQPSYQAHGTTTGSTCTLNYVGNTSTVDEYIDSPILESITGTNIRVEFLKRNPYSCFTQDELTNEIIYYSCDSPQLFKREDLLGWSSSSFTGRMLKDIRVRDKISGSWEDKLTYSFEQSYFRPAEWPNIGDSFYGNSTTYQYDGVNSYRLRLDKITFPDNQQLSFDYYEYLTNYAPFPGLNVNMTQVSESSPGSFSTDRYIFAGENAKDHWGYFNGNTTSSDKRFGTGECQNTFCSVRDRTSNVFYSILHSLKKITSNRGTETTFEYELHDANNYKAADGTLLPIGGNRIAKIISKDLISGISTVKKYQYKTFGSNPSSSGFLIMKPVYRFSYNGNYGTVSGKAFGYNESLYLAAISQLSRPYISYKNVTESIYSTTGDVSTVETDNRLLVTNKFTYNQLETEVDVCSPSSGYGYYPNLFTPKIDYESQNLLKSESYTRDNKLVSVTEMEYGLVSTNYIIQGKRYLYLNEIAPVESQKASYSFTVKHAYLKREVQRNYDYSGSNYTENEVNYFYKNDTEIPAAYRTSYPGQHYQVVKTTTKDSKGNTIENWNKYAADFDFGTHQENQPQCYLKYDEDARTWSEVCNDNYVEVQNVPTNVVAKAIYNLKSKNMVAVPIESISKRNSKIIAANYNTYNDTNCLLKENYSLKSFPLSTFTEAKWNGSSSNLGAAMAIDANYVLSNTINTYNVYGFPTESKVNFGAKTTMTYQTNNLLPYQTTNASGTPEAQTSTVTFDSPLFGVSKQTAPNGVFTTNVYEVGTGRLIKVTDRSGNIIKHIEYKPKGQ